MKQEKFPWLAANPFYTQRFAFYVGRRCREATLQAVARELRLNWKTVKALEMEYMREQLRRTGTPAPAVIGIDEIAIRKGHTYRIVVSDLVRRRPIWFGGQDRSEASLDQFYAWLGPRKCRKIRLAVMDMWKAFRTSTLKVGHAAGRHSLRQVSCAASFERGPRQDPQERIPPALGPRSSLHQRPEVHLAGPLGKPLPRRQKGIATSLPGQPPAEQGVSAQRIVRSTVGLLEPGWARRFFDQWQAALRWQGLKPYEKFARLVESHWEGIALYCQPENKIALGFVEGLNNKIRVFQRRAYGIRDEEYLRLKVLTCMLPAI